MVTQEERYQIYSPASVVGTFNNALIIPQTLHLIYLKGRYTAGQGKSYAGYYYDYLYSESDTTSISLKLSGILRSKLINNEVYVLKGFIEKSIRNSSIDLRFVAEEIVQQEEKQISEEDLKRYELIQAKLEKGSINLESFIREKILKNEKIRIANIYGHSAIVQKDFAEGIDVASAFFEIVEYSCNITSKSSIGTQLNELRNLNYDIIALVRGGGDRQSFDVFNDTELAFQFLDFPSIMVTALGHSVDETLLDKLADKSFHLPHDYGIGLYRIIEKIKEERSNSRAILIDEVKKDISKQFTEQVKTLEDQLKKKNEEFVTAQKTFKESVEKQTKTFNDQLKVRNEEVEKLKLDLSKKHDEQVKTLSNQLTKKNDEFIEAQKTFKEQVENQTKTFNEQLKIRNEEVDKLKKDLSDKHREQIKTISEQLNKKNDEFLKLQENNQKELENIHKNYQVQQANRLKEMEDYKKEINDLHEKNIQISIQQRTAELSTKLSSVQEELRRTKLEKGQPNVNWLYIFISIIIGLFIGFIFFKML
jgi:hypothetical protein